MVGWVNRAEGCMETGSARGTDLTSKLKPSQPVGSRNA